MSTSEFERRSPGSAPDPHGFPRGDRAIPSDFSEEELAFARELEVLFPIAEEELPPFYVQTLLAAEDPRLQVAEPAFEKKVSTRVFRRLNLHRRLFCPYHSPRSVLSLRHSRPLVAAGIACMLFMLVTMAAAGPLFAAGLNYLWAGAHSGVLQVKHYPVVASPSPTPAAQDESSAQKPLTFEQAQQVLHFPIYWPDYLPLHYNQSDTYLYDADQSWADGPIMVIDFYYSLPGQPSRLLSICEFKPQGNVLQVVQDGAAIKIGQDTSPSAIYVEGQWRPDGSSSYSWVYNNRSELIFEHGNLIFWIVGDKAGGIDKDALSNIANSLHLFDMRNIHLNQITREVGEAPSVFANDVIYLDDPMNPGGPSFFLVGAPPKPALVPKNLVSIP